MQRNNQSKKMTKEKNAAIVNQQALQKAFQIGNDAQFAKLLEDRAFDSSFIDEDGNGFLHKLLILMEESSSGSCVTSEAVIKKWLAMFTMAMAKGNINMKNKNGYTPLYVAAYMDDTKLGLLMVEVLLDAKADLSIVGGKGKSFIGVCLDLKKYACVKLVLNKINHLSETDVFQLYYHALFTPLDKDFLQLIWNKFGFTVKNHYHLVNICLQELGSIQSLNNPNVRRNLEQLREILRFLEVVAAEKRFYESGELYSDIGKQPSQELMTFAEAYSELISCCVALNETALMKHMLDHGVVYKATRNKSPYMLARSTSNLDAENILFPHEFNSFDREASYTPMHRVALLNDIECAKKFIQRNTIVKQTLDRLAQDDERRSKYKTYTFREKDHANYTPLHIAVINNHTLFVEFLLNEQSISLNENDLNESIMTFRNDHMTILDIAMDCRLYDIADKLIAKGASLARCNNLPNFMMAAVLEDNTDKIRFMLKHKIVFSIRKNHLSILQLAIEKNALELFKKLVQVVYEDPYYAINRTAILNYPALMDTALQARNTEFLDLIAHYAMGDSAYLYLMYVQLKQMILLALLKNDVFALNYFTDSPRYFKFTLDDQGNNLLHHVIINGQIDIFKLIIKKSRINEVLEFANQKGITPLDMIRENHDFYAVYQETLAHQNNNNSIAPISKEEATITEKIEQTIQSVDIKPRKAKKKKVKKKNVVTEDDESTVPHEYVGYSKNTTESTPSVAETGLTLFGITSTTKTINPIKKERINTWRNILNECRNQGYGAHNIVRIGWDNWGIGSEEIHKKFPEVYDIFTTVLHGGSIPYQSNKHGVYVVGSSALNLLYIGQIKIEHNDIDIVFIGINTVNVHDTLQAKIHSGKFNVHDKFVIINQSGQSINQSRGLINLNFPQEDQEEKSKSIDLLCYSINEFEESIMARDFTITSIMVDVMRQQIVAPLDWLDDLINRKIRAIGDPDNNFSQHFVRKIRGLRLYAKLRDKGFTMEQNTENAIKNTQTRFHPNKDADCVEVINHLAKLIAGTDLDSAYKLLNEFNLLAQITIDRDSISRVLTHEFIHAKFRTNTKDYELYKSIIKPLAEELILNLNDVDQFISEHASNFKQMLVLCEELSRDSFYSHLVNKFIGLLMMSAASLEPILSKTETEPTQEEGCKINLQIQ